MPAELPHVVEHLVQCLALDELHHIVVQSVHLPNAEHRHNIRVMKPGGGACLALESLQNVAPSQLVGVQYFECDVAAQGDLHGLVNKSHAARADAAQNSEVTNLLRFGENAAGRE